MAGNSLSHRGPHQLPLHVRASDIIECDLVVIQAFGTCDAGDIFLFQHRVNGDLVQLLELGLPELIKIRRGREGGRDLVRGNHRATGSQRRRDLRFTHQKNLRLYRAGIRAGSRQRRRAGGEIKCAVAHLDLTILLDRVG